MITFFVYLLKVSCWIAVWWLIYHFFLRKETFYTFNRVYLMTGVAASFLIPLMKIHYPVEVFMMQTSTVAVAESAQAPAHQVDIYSILFYLYISCAVLLIIRQLFLLLKINAMIRSAGYTIADNYRLVNSRDTKISFSFYKYIFLNLQQIPEEEKKLILAHERSHILQCHWIDLVIAESICIVLWFNPFAWLYLRSVKENHEYLADEAVIHNGYSPVYYRAALINQSLNTSIFPLVNSFAYYKFKRISMMKKETSSPLKKLAVMLLIPAACFFLWAFSEPEYHVITTEFPQQPKDVYLTNNDSVTVKNANEDHTVKTTRITVVSSKDTLKINSNSSNYSSPLFIVDGKESFSIQEITPDQIESIDVLKDESAVRVYGEKGKNGVVIIKIKKNDQTSDSSAISKIKLNGKIDNITYTNGLDTNDQPHVQNKVIILNNSIYPDSVLIIVDGKESSSIQEIDPNQIKSVDVLKDESAVRAHGEKGKNGVILITTKKGNNASGTKGNS